MRILLDTHALLWWAFGEKALSRRARALIEDPENVVLVSSASAWEIATKYRLGRLPSAKVLVQDMPGWFDREGVTQLPITIAHAQRAGMFDQAHRDPFDRMLAAQSLLEEVPLVGQDPVFADFGVHLLW